MHLFERTVVMPQVDEIPLPPIHVIFFEAFAKRLKPKYCISIDVGTVPTETTISRLMRSMDRTPKIAGVCGKLTTYRPNFCQVTVPISNILDRSMGSVFGFIHVLPGAFSAYRCKTVKTKEHPLTGEPEGPLVRYMDQLGPFLGNMHLAEDRILCFEIVARLNERWTMHYCKGAVAKTDVETIEVLIRQSRRWLNGTFFVAVYTVMRFPCVVNDTVHSVARKFFFFKFFLTVTWMFLSNLYLIFYFIWKGGFRHTFGDSGDEKGGENALLFMSFLMVQFVIGLGNRPEDVSLVYLVSIFYFGALMVVTLILFLVPLSSVEIWLIRDENYCDAAKEDVAEGVEGAEKKTEVLGKRGVPAASTVSARDYGPSEAISMGGGCTGTSVSSKANEVSESSDSWGMVPSPTSAGVVWNVPRRRDGRVNNVKGGVVMNAEIEHFVHIISAFVVLLSISFFIIGYANAIHSTVANVPQGLLLIGLTLTAKRKRMLATNLEGVETIECASCTCSEMGTLTQNNFMNGTVTSTCTNVLLCGALLLPHHVCKH